MKMHTPLLAAAVLVGTVAGAAGESATVTMHAIDANGVGKEIGTLSLSDTADGLQITPRLAGLPPGDALTSHITLVAEVFCTLA